MQNTTELRIGEQQDPLAQTQLLREVQASISSLSWTQRAGLHTAALTAENVSMKQVNQDIIVDQGAPLIHSMRGISRRAGTTLPRHTPTDLTGEQIFLAAFSSTSAHVRVWSMGHHGQASMSLRLLQAAHRSTTPVLRYDW